MAIIDNWRHWWIEFEGRSPACAGMQTRTEAEALGNRVGKVKEMHPLPYPANPRLDTETNGWGKGQHPSFCHAPEKCKGRFSCPQARACDD